MVQNELRILGTVEGGSQKLDFFQFNISVICRIMPSCRCPLHNPQNPVIVTLTWGKELADGMELKTLSHKNKVESAVVRWMNLESVIQSEASQKEKNKYVY